MELAQGRYWQLLDAVFTEATDGCVADILPSKLALVVNYAGDAASFYAFLQSVGVLDADLVLVHADEFTKGYRDADRKKAERARKKLAATAQPSLPLPDAGGHVPDAGGHVPDASPVSSLLVVRSLLGGSQEAAPPFASLPVTGEGKDALPWLLTEEHVQKLEAAWVGVDVRAQLRKWVSLVETGGQPRRTRKGYPKAATNWLSKAVEFAKGPRAFTGGASGDGALRPGAGGGGRPVRRFNDEPGGRG